MKFSDLEKMILESVRSGTITTVENMALAMGRDYKEVLEAVGELYARGLVYYDIDFGVRASP